MPYGLTTTGFEPKPQSQIELDLQTKFRSRISQGFNLSATDPIGQFILIAASEIAQAWEAEQLSYSSRDPSQATDDAQDTIGEVRGLPRIPASPSTALMTITLAAGTYAAGSLVVQRNGDPDIRFTNDEEITTAGATLTDVPFTCTEDGPTVAPANTLTVIANPVVGFSAPDNPTAATPGAFREENDDYRLRQEESLQVFGSTSVNAIRADLLDPEKVPGATYVAVYENDSDAYDPSFDLPPHSVGVVIRGGDDAVIARQIYLSKAGGIQASGVVSENVVTSSGQTVTIGFTRPTEVELDLVATVSVLADEWATAPAYEAAAIDMIEAAWARFQGVGKDVLYKRYEGELLDDELGNGMAGTFNVDVDIDIVGGTPVSADYAIDYDEIAILNSVTIIVNFFDAEP